MCLTPGAVLSLLGPESSVQSATEAVPKMLARSTRPRHRRPVWTASLRRTDDDLSRRAAEYRRRIRDSIREKNRGSYADQLATIEMKLGQWQQQVTRLVSRLSAFDADTMLQRDRPEVPTQIARLEARLDGEKDAPVRLQMQETLDGYPPTGRSWTPWSSDAPDAASTDQTLSAMGTIYSQVQMLQAMEIDGIRARQIADDIADQVAGLSDLLTAMAEVYGVPNDGAGTTAASSSPDSDRGRKLKLTTRSERCPWSASDTTAAFPITRLWGILRSFETTPGRRSYYRTRVNRNLAANRPGVSG